MKFLSALLLVFSCFFMIACSDDDPAPVAPASGGSGGGTVPPGGTGGGSDFSFATPDFEPTGTPQKFSPEEVAADNFLPKLQGIFSCEKSKDQEKFKTHEFKFEYKMSYSMRSFWNKNVSDDKIEIGVDTLFIQSSEKTIKKSDFSNFSVGQKNFMEAGDFVEIEGCNHFSCGPSLSGSEPLAPEKEKEFEERLSEAEKRSENTNDEQTVCRFKKLPIYNNTNYPENHYATFQEGLFRDQPAVKVVIVTPGEVKCTDKEGDKKVYKAQRKAQEIVLKARYPLFTDIVSTLDGVEKMGSPTGDNYNICDSEQIQPLLSSRVQITFDEDQVFEQGSVELNNFKIEYGSPLPSHRIYSE